MNDPEIDRLIKKESPKEKDNLFLCYVIYLFPFLLAILVFSFAIFAFLAFFKILPLPNYGFFGWIASLVASLMLAVLVLIGLLSAQIKGKKGSNAAFLKSEPGRALNIRGMDKVGNIIVTLVEIAWGLCLLILIARILNILTAPDTTAQAAWRALLALLALGFHFFLFFVGFFATFYGLRPITDLLVPGVDDKEKRGKVNLLFWEQLRSRNFPCYVVTDEEREQDKIVQRIKGNAYCEFARGCGLIISDCDHAVAVTDGFEFKGVKGPGTIFTGFADEPLRTLDLRPQLRTFTPQAFTKDGILVEALVFAPFQISRGGRPLEVGRPFPFRTKSAIEAVQAQRMQHPGTAEPTTQRSWDELPEILGIPLLQNILAQYTFDELYDPFQEQDKLPRIRIAEELLAELKKELAQVGIDLIGGGISNIRPVDPQVIEERIRSWQAEWQRRTMVKQAESHRLWLQQVEQARAEAQTELILSLGKKLADLGPGTGIPPDQLVRQFLETLEQFMARPSLQRRLPQSAMGELQDLQGSV